MQSQLPNFLELETQGFVLIKGFLDETELAKICTTYNNSIQYFNTNGFPNKNYSIFYANIPDSVTEKCKKLLEQIQAHSKLTTNRILNKNKALYFDNNIVGFGWHQDHEDYFLWQSTQHQLNFWIPIIKPDSFKDGLDIIPLDTFARHDPTFVNNHVIGQGAKSCAESGADLTRIRDDENDNQYILNYNINEQGLTLPMVAGDLLLLRGDVFHKTPTKNQHRVAISIRALDDRQLLTKNKFLSGGARKREMINNNSGGYRILRQGFEKHDIVSIGEVLDGTF